LRSGERAHGDTIALEYRVVVPASGEFMGAISTPALSLSKNRTGVAITVTYVEEVDMVYVAVYA
jgi:hypothetical protein